MCECISAALVRADSADASWNSSTRGGGKQDIISIKSSGFGAKWGPPRNLSMELDSLQGLSKACEKSGGCYHVSLGNGHGIQLRPPSPWAGRLLMPAYGVTPQFSGPGGPSGSSVYFSDDGGRTWNSTASLSLQFGVGSAEGEFVQIPGHPSGAVLANLRNVNGSTNGMPAWGCENVAEGMCRISAISLDGGVSWVRDWATQITVDRRSFFGTLRCFSIFSSILLICGCALLIFSLPVFA